MDRLRTKSAISRLKRPAIIGGIAVALVRGGVTRANIDFRSQRVARAAVAIDTVQRGTIEIKVAANGQLLAQVPARVANADIKPGAVVEAGQVLVKLIATADEAQSAEAELQTSMLNQEVVLTQVQLAVKNRGSDSSHVHWSVPERRRNGLMNGTVGRVDPGVTDGTVAVDVDLEGAMPAGARPQSQIERVITLDRLQNMLFVAKPSYVRDDAAIAVYRLHPSAIRGAGDDQGRQRIVREARS
jgi:hypothetical protein